MSATEAEERAQFTLTMRARGINDLRLLRALERAPRALFMPQRFADISGRDITLPIGCGQTSPPPSIVAAMIAALAARKISVTPLRLDLTDNDSRLRFEEAFARR